MDARGFSGARRVARRRPENASTGPTRQARRLGRRCQRGGRRCLGIGPIPCNGAASGLRDRRRRLQRRCQRGGRRCLANGPIPFNGAASGATGQTLRLVRRRRLRLCPGSTVTPTAIDSTRRPALAPPPHTNTRERLRITSNGADSRPPLTISGPAHEHTRTRADHCERLDITNNGRTAPDLTKTGQDHDSRTHKNGSIHAHKLTTNTEKAGERDTQNTRKTQKLRTQNDNKTNQTKPGQTRSKARKIGHATAADWRRLDGDARRRGPHAAEALRIDTGAQPGETRPRRRQRHGRRIRTATARRHVARGRAGATRPVTWWKSFFTSTQRPGSERGRRHARRSRRDTARDRVPVEREGSRGWIDPPFPCRPRRRRRRHATGRGRVTTREHVGPRPGRDAADSGGRSSRGHRPAALSPRGMRGARDLRGHAAGAGSTAEARGGPRPAALSPRETSHAPAW